MKTECLGWFNKTIIVYYNGEKKSKAIKIKDFVKYNEGDFLRNG